MRIDECVVEHRTVQRVNQLFLIIHVSFFLFVLWYCATLDNYNPDFFGNDGSTLFRLIRRSSSCFAYEIQIWCDACLRTEMYKTYAYSVTRMKYNVHDMMHNESYIRTQLISIACTMFLQKLRGHFFLAVGDILWPFFVSSQGPFAPFRCVDWKPRLPLQWFLGKLETFTWEPWQAWGNLYNVTLETLRTFTM